MMGADTSFIGMYFGLKAYTGALKILGKKHRWLVVIGASVFIISFQVLMNIFFTFPSVVVGNIQLCRMEPSSTEREHLVPCDVFRHTGVHHSDQGDAQR